MAIVKLEAPNAMPNNGQMYTWDEASTNWVKYASQE